MSTSSPMLLFHISAAVVGLLSGFLAVALRKGSGLHAAAGNVFFISMLSMSSSAAYIATFMSPNKVNFVVAVLTFYLVSTAWMAAKRRDGKPGLFDRVALLVVLADGIGAMTWGFQAAGSPRGLKDGMPAFLYFLFGSAALLCAALDVRMLRRGGFVGPKRILRHLGRMCFALLIAVFSFYPGQAKLIPASSRAAALLFVPHLLLIGSMIFWTVRMRRRSRKELAARSERADPAWPGPATAVAQPLMTVHHRTPT